MIAQQDVTLATEGARRFEAHFAPPQKGRGTGVIFLHDMFGLNPIFRDLADAYAARGYCAIVPNQFWSCPFPDALPHVGGHERAWKRLETFDFDACAKGMQLTIDWLRRQPSCSGKVAAVGFCFAGRLAYLAAARTDVDAAASFYALGISKNAAESSRIACPLQLHYGSEDEHVPQSEVDEVARAVAGRANIELFMYQGCGHSFVNPIRPTFDAAAAKLAYGRVDAMLDRIAAREG
jgi:carboxymethylenebutenolidase